MAGLDQVNILKNHLKSCVLGQENLIDHLILALLCRGHVLLEGAPGLAKTRIVDVLARSLGVSFKRVQFTPDLLPSDLIGSMIYDPQKAGFSFHQGPIFHEFILADEINRAPAKVQSALLEAMAERQVSVFGSTYRLSEDFFVMATQNPIEQEGTYRLPEAQLDRFFMKIDVQYPAMHLEQDIVSLMENDFYQDVDVKRDKTVYMTMQDLSLCRVEIQKVHVAPALRAYMTALSHATRHRQEWISFGVSLRGVFALHMACKARAWSEERSYVTPDDVQKLLAPIFGHRMGLSFAAQSQKLKSADILEKILCEVPCP